MFTGIVTDVGEVVVDTAEGFRPVVEKAGLELVVAGGDDQRLDAAGVCAARLNIAKMFGVTPSQSEAQRTIDRIRGLGWHVRVHVRGNDLLEFSDVLKSVRGIPMVIDHLGHVDLRKGLDQPVCRWILDILQRDNWWMMASNGNRDSSMESGWDDAVPVGRAYIEAAPTAALRGADGIEALDIMALLAERLARTASGAAPSSGTCTRMPDSSRSLRSRTAAWKPGWAAMPISTRSRSNPLKQPALWPTPYP